MKGVSGTVNPCYPLEPDAILLCLGDSCSLQALLHFVIEDIWFGDLDIRRVRTRRIGCVVWRCWDHFRNVELRDALVCKESERCDDRDP